MCCGESEDFKTGKEEIIGTFAAYKTWWDTVWRGHLAGVRGTRARWKALVESTCRRDFTSSVAEAVCVYMSAWERLDRDICRWGTAEPTEMLAGRRK